MAFTEDENSWLYNSATTPIKNWKTHNEPINPPLCEQCKTSNLMYFDPTCVGCCDVLSRPETTIAQIFAIIRQWVPKTQQKIDLLVLEIFKHGANVNVRDTLTDMNLLHYVAKSGALGIGDVNVSLKTAKYLINKGISVNAKSRWTDMTALHYAVFFDVHSIVSVLLKFNDFGGIDQPCKEFQNGTALHIGCKNLSLKSVQILVEHDANPHFLDDSGYRPIDCIPKPEDLTDQVSKDIASSLRNELNFAMKKIPPNSKKNLSTKLLNALGLHINDQVTVNGKVGLLRFAGSTEFASGQWAGIEFEKRDGKNDGSVGDVRYFKCREDHGIFAPITKVKKYNPDHVMLSLSPSPEPDQPTRQSSPKQDDVFLFGLKLGEKVIVAGQKTGFVRYRGPTKFAAGTWVGVELEDPAGKNDGSVADYRYFTCKPNHGVFAPLSKVQRIEDLMEEERQGEVPSTVKKYHEYKKKYDVAESKIFTKSDSKEVVEDDEENEGHDSLEEKKQESRKKKCVQINEKIQQSVEHLSQPRKPQEKIDKTFGAQVNFTLKSGMSVYVNGEIGIVRFIGRVTFSHGIWIGVELRKPNGKNDGSIDGKRYFLCKPNYGLMVRPNRATCRGINCEQLVDLKFR